jgi:hypothetical protein
MDDFTVGLRESLGVIHVPIEGLEKRIDKIATQLCFVILASEVTLTEILIFFKEFLNSFKGNFGIDHERFLWQIPFKGKPDQAFLKMRMVVR